MAIKLFKRPKEYEYVPVSERNEKKPVTFVFKPLSKEEKAKLEDKLVTVNPDQTINISNASYLLNVFKMCVTDIKNLVDEDGKEVKPKFEHGMIADSFLDMLPDDIIQEVGQVIVSVSKDPLNADLYLGKIDKEETKKD